MGTGRQVWSKTYFAAPPSVAPRAAGATCTGGMLRHMPAISAVVAAVPTAADSMAINPASYDAARLAIGAILATILLIWTLVGCGTGRHCPPQAQLVPGLLGRAKVDCEAA